MTIETNKVETHSPDVTVYRVVVADGNNFPPPVNVELTGIGKRVFDQLESESK